MRWFFVVVLLGLGGLLGQLLASGAFRSAEAGTARAADGSLIETIATLSLAEAVVFTAVLATLILAGQFLREAVARVTPRGTGGGATLQVAFFANVLLLAGVLVGLGFAVKQSAPLTTVGNLFLLALTQVVLGTFLIVALFFARKSKVFFASLTTVHVVELGIFAAIYILGTTA